MKKLLLSLILSAVIGGGVVITATTSVQAVAPNQVTEMEDRCISGMPNTIYRVHVATPLFRNSTGDESVAHLSVNSHVQRLSTPLQNGRMYVENSAGVRGWVNPSHIVQVPSCK